MALSFSLFSTGLKKIVFAPEATNPLDPCPSSPNCERQTFHIAMQVETLYPLILQTLDEMRSEKINGNSTKQTINAVFKVLFFRDDVSILFKKDKAGTLLHIRSASRKGHYDFGVNRRRVRNIIQTLETYL